jgi:hypothetical protein
MGILRMVFLLQILDPVICIPRCVISWSWFCLFWNIDIFGVVSGDIRSRICFLFHAYAAGLFHHSTLVSNPLYPLDISSMLRAVPFTFHVQRHRRHPMRPSSQKSGSTFVPSVSCIADSFTVRVAIYLLKTIEGCRVLVGRWIVR